MPVFTTPISQQNQGSAAGVIGYPSVGSVKQFIVLSDEFNRETMNPTNAIALYTQANNQGTGAATVVNLAQLQIATTGLANDDNTVRTSGLAFTRTSDLDNRTNLTFSSTFAVSAATSIAFFVGLVQQGTALTGLPTTVRHLGCYVDTSVSNNIKLSSANGTTQVTTDTTLAVSSSVAYKLTIVWNGDDSATITLYSFTVSSQTITYTLISTQTVSSFCNGSAFFVGNEIHFYCKTLTGSTRSISIREWNMQAI